MQLVRDSLGNPHLMIIDHKMIIIDKIMTICLTCRCTPLHNAAGKGFSEIVQLLIQAGADVHIRADKVTVDNLYSSW